ncbi:MAG: hypothetical protein FWF41_08430, partial [Betaproteobacteria bacterium]|nr:hypothetical protein [Betaproteobacteria bacterium]
MECPAGTQTRSKGNGTNDLECWYLPASNCDTVGSNGGSGGGSGFSGSSFATGGGMSASAGGGAQGKVGLASSSCNLIGNPINTALLNKVQREEDLPMLPGGLQFARHFNSAPVLPLHFDVPKTTWYYWRHTYMRRIIVPDNTLNILGVAWRETGQMDYYGADGKPLANLNGGASTLQRTGSGWTLTQGNGDKEIYDDEGKLTSLVALSGATKTLTYSDNTTPADVAPKPGLLIVVTDGFGRQLHLGYDDDSRLLWMMEPAGHVFWYAYENNHSGNLSQVIYPDQTSRSYLYEDAKWPHALTGIVDAEGNRLSTYAYNANGEAVSTKQADGVESYSITSTTNSQTLARSTTITNALGGRIGKVYLPQGGAYKPYAVYYYPCSGSGCSFYGEYYTYDANGNVSEYRSPLSTYNQYTYDLFRNLETKRIEGLNSNRQSTPATRTTSTIWHPTLRLPVQIAEPLKITTITYDAAGRVLTRTVQATTDANGSQGFAVVPIGTARTWTNAYDNLGNLTRAQAPDGTATTYTYYPPTAVCADGHLGCRGQTQSTTDSQGLTTTFDNYDPDGRLLHSTGPYGVVTTQTYDWRGRLLTRAVHADTDLTTVNAYDTSGLLIETTQPDGVKLYYNYDTAERLIRLRDDHGNRIDYTLDAMSQKTAETVYDPLGNLRRMSSRSVNPFGT